MKKRDRKIDREREREREREGCDDVNEKEALKN
jgi:hypothetical protein